MSTISPDEAGTVAGTGFSNNGVADAIREQIGEPRERTFKPKVCDVCDQEFTPNGPAQKRHAECKPQAKNGNGKTATKAAAEAGKGKGDTPARKRRRRAPARQPRPAAPTSLTARLTADCDQELQRLNGELERIEQGIQAMRDEQNKLKDERAKVERVQKALTR